MLFGKMAINKNDQILAYYFILNYIPLLYHIFLSTSLYNLCGPCFAYLINKHGGNSLQIRSRNRRWLCPLKDLHLPIVGSIRHRCFHGVAHRQWSGSIYHLGTFHQQIDIFQWVADWWLSLACSKYLNSCSKLFKILNIPTQPEPNH